MKRSPFILFAYSFAYACFFYFLFGDEAIGQDASSYYHQYRLNNISFDDFISLIDRLFTEQGGGGVQISFSSINVFAHVYFGTLALLPFNIFLFVNLLFLSVLAFWTLSKITSASALTIFLILFSLPMLVNMHFTWRQSYSQFFAFLFLLTTFKYKRLIIFLLVPLIHPFGLAIMSEKNFPGIYLFTLRRVILVALFLSIGIFISKFSTISSNINDDSYLLPDFKFMIWLLIYFLYSAPLILARSRVDLSSTNFWIFSSLIVGYSIFSFGIVGISRLVAFGSVSLMLYSILLLPKSVGYYKILSPALLLPYFFLVR
jgi:hypothetical protein